MGAIRKKLNSSRGASILMALLLLLVAMMVSVVILSAAVSAAASIHSDQDQQQAYLTVSSATKLLRQALESSSCTITQTNGGTKQIAAKSSDLESLLQAAVTQVATYSSSYTNTLTIAADDETMGDVTADFTMDTDYSIAVRMHLTNTSGGNYNITLRLTAGQTSESFSGDDGSVHTETIVTTITWANPVITKGVVTA